MADVFISYHRSDSASALVRRIVSELENMGISCWYDTKDPKLGYFTDAITNEIEQCKVFLLLWDEGANESRYCISETHYAFTYAKSALIVPFQVGEFERNRKLSLYTGPYQIIFDKDELIKKIAAEFGKEYVTRGYCGARNTNVRYELDENGVLKISGTGPIRNFYWDINTQTCYVPWWTKRATISRVRILNGVTSIGDYAFHDCTELLSVDIPESVTSIGENSFAYCERLASLKIPDSVTFIGDFAFWNCSRLTSFDIPDSITSIGAFAFSNCVSLTSINIPDSVTSIRIGAFLGCANLKNVIIPLEAEISLIAFEDTTEVIRRPIK